MKRTSDRLALFVFGVSIALFVFGYGVAVGKYRIFPYRIFVLASKGFDALRIDGRPVIPGQTYPIFYREGRPQLPPIVNTDQAYPGLNLVVQISTGLNLSAKVMDLSGETFHEWDIDWYEVWPDATHVPDRFLPRGHPGTHVHGAVLMENGDLVFNFEHLGLVRMDWQGEVVWRLPYQTHHSVHLHDDGNLWVCGQKEHAQPSKRFPNRTAPFEEYTILEVTPDGKIAQE